MLCLSIPLPLMGRSVAVLFIAAVPLGQVSDRDACVARFRCSLRNGAVLIGEFSHPHKGAARSHYAASMRTYEQTLVRSH
jgi:hypothetical protein